MLTHNIQVEICEETIICSFLKEPPILAIKTEALTLKRLALTGLNH